MSRFQAAVLALLGLIACAVFAWAGLVAWFLVGQAPSAGGQAAAYSPTPAPAAIEAVEPTSTQVGVPTPTPLPPTARPLPATATSTRVVADTPAPSAELSPSLLTPIPTAAPPEQNFEAAQVINVVDGDTIDVLLNGAEYRVRYILVDTPETKHPTKGVQPFGPEASSTCPMAEWSTRSCCGWAWRKSQRFRPM